MGTGWSNSNTDVSSTKGVLDGLVKAQSLSPRGRGKSFQTAAETLFPWQEDLPVSREGRRSNSLIDTGKHLPQYQSFDAILTIPFFEDLTPSRAKQLSTLFERRKCSPNELIVREGADLEHSFFVIIQGSVRLTARRRSVSVSELKELPESALIVHLADLQKGSCFGTTALISNSDSKPVGITATALEETILMSITKEKFSQFAQTNDLFPCLKASPEPLINDPNPEPLSVLFRLRALPFFMGMDDTLLRQLGVLFEFRRYSAADVILNQGDAMDGFYVLVKGSIEITTILSSGERKHFGTITPQDCFGELSLIEQTVCLATYTPRTEVVVVTLRTDKFVRFLQLAPEIVNHEHFQNLIRKRTAEALKRIPIFSSYQKKQIGPLEQYDEHSLALLAGLFQFAEYSARMDFYRQGQPADTFFIVVQGRVQVWSESTVDGNKDIQVEELRDGDWFGETALYGSDEKEARRTENVTALAKTVVLKLSSANFAQLKLLAPGIWQQIEQRLSMKTASKIEKIPFFKGIRENKPWSKIGLLGSLFKYELFAAGSIVCKEGEIGDKFFVIVEGKMSVRVKQELSDEELELETLSNDQWFGEMSLLLHTPRCATVIAQVSSLVLSLTADSFKRFLEITPELSDSFKAMATSRTANTLKRFGFFQAVKENRAWSKLELLASLMNYEVYEANQVVFPSGSIGDKFYIVAQGSVDVFIENGDQLKKIDHLEDGGYFGEIALLEETKRTATVITIKQTVLLAITHEAFGRFLKIAPELTPIIKNTISTRRETLSKGKADEFDLGKQDA